MTSEFPCRRISLCSARASRSRRMIFLRSNTPAATCWWRNARITKTQKGTKVRNKYFCAFCVLLLFTDREQAGGRANVHHSIRQRRRRHEQLAHRVGSDVCE